MGSQILLWRFPNDPDGNPCWKSIVEQYKNVRAPLSFIQSKKEKVKNMQFFKNIQKDMMTADKVKFLFRQSSTSEEIKMTISLQTRL